MVSETLSEYIRRIIRERGLNYRKVEANAKDGGFEISHSTVGNIINQTSKGVGVETLKALAAGLQVPEDELMALAMRDATDAQAREDAFERSEFAIMFHQYKDLSPEDKHEISIILKMVDSEIKRRRLLRPPPSKHKTTKKK